MVAECTVDDINPALYLKEFLVTGNAGCISSTVGLVESGLRFAWSYGGGET